MEYKVQCRNDLWDISSRYDRGRNQFSYARFDRYDCATPIVTILEIEIFLCQRS